MNNGRYLLGVLLITLIIVIFLFSRKNQTNTLPSIAETFKPTTTLTLSPNPITSYPNSGADIILDTGKDAVRFVQIKLLYNPKYVYDMTVTQGPMLKNALILNNYVNQEIGSLTYILNLPKKMVEIQGKGVIATLTFKTFLEPKQNTYLRFSPETLVTNDASPRSILQKTHDTIILRRE